MKPKKLNETKIRTHEFRVSFPQLFKEGQFQGESTGYSVTALFEDDRNLKLFRKLVDEAVEAAIENKWPNKRPKNLKLPQFKEDSERAEEEGKIVCRFKSGSKPFVIGPQRDPIDDTSEIYGGCYGIAVVQAGAWENNFGKGVSLFLGGFQKTKDGKPFGGGATVDDFEDVDEDDEGPFN